MGWKSSENPAASGNITGARALTHPCNRPSCLGADGPVGVVGRERLLGEDVEAGEQAEGPVAIEVVDVTAAFLVEQFQRQERQQCTRGGHHRRAGIPCLRDQTVEAESGQQRHEEEEARDARAERAAGREVQLSTVRDFRRFGAGSVLARARPERSPATVREKKGGATPRRQSTRKRLAMDRSAEGL